MGAAFFIKRPLFNFRLLMIKGRNSTLVNRRNQKLILRYYYWHEVKRRRRDDVIELLSEEFYLQPYTIGCILHANLELFKQLKKEKPQPSRLQQYEWGVN